MVAWERETRSLYAAHAHEVAAVILEPLLQGAGGMRFHSPHVVQVLAELAREHGALVIFDEIATGFGRTGTMFALERAAVVPDILCVGKALTGGYLSLAAVLCTDAVAQGVSSERAGGALMHGPTFMANPLACSVALASLTLLQDNDFAVQVRNLETGLTAGLKPAQDLRRRGRRPRPRRSRRDPAARAGPGRRPHRGGVGARRVDPPVPRPRLHDAALRHDPRRPGHHLRRHGAGRCHGPRLRRMHP